MPACVGTGGPGVWGWCLGGGEGWRGRGVTRFRRFTTASLTSGLGHGEPVISRSPRLSKVLSTAMPGVWWRTASGASKVSEGCQVSGAFVEVSVGGLLGVVNFIL